MASTATDPVASAPAAESSASIAAASTPVLFKSQEAGAGFPWAGACLLVLLAVIAVLARWRAAGYRDRGPKWLQRWLAASGAGRPSESCVALTMQSSIRLDAQTQLHAVQWRDRHFLIATSSNAGPVLLHSESPAETPSEASS